MGLNKLVLNFNADRVQRDRLTAHSTKATVMRTSSTPRAAPARAVQFSDLHVIRQLWPFLWPRQALHIRTRLAAALVFLFIAKGAIVAVPLFYREAIDALTADIIYLPLLAILGYGLARVTGLLFGELRDLVFLPVAARAIRTVSAKVFAHLHQLSLSFHLDRQTGGLTRSVERGTKAIDSLCTYLLLYILPTILEIALVTLVFLWLFPWPFAATTLLILGGYVAFTAWITEWRLPLIRRLNDADQAAYTQAIDALLNYETVKYFGNEQHENQRLDRALVRYEQAQIKSKQSLAVLNIGQGAIIAGGASLVMYWAAAGIRDNTMTLGDFVLINTYLIQLYQPLNSFGVLYRTLKQSLVDIEALFGLLQAPITVADAPDALPLRVTRGVVHFENVRFAYDTRRVVLRDVSFAIDAGCTTAVVGATGSGKSTLARLLYRFYDVDAGRIAIDDQDIRQVTQTSLRQHIGVVPQDTVLFNDTIYYNIAYGRPSALPHEVEEAARLAELHDFIESLPDGYQTRVGERGLKLSGGEKQRVAIARTILKNPPLLIFDEATSALDSHTEQAIQQNLQRLREGRTALVIAHRLSTIVDADDIVVLHQGEIVERGNHATLLALNGRYAALWANQHRAKRPDDQDDDGDDTDLTATIQLPTLG